MKRPTAPSNVESAEVDGRGKEEAPRTVCHWALSSTQRQHQQHAGAGWTLEASLDCWRRRVGAWRPADSGRRRLAPTARLHCATHTEDREKTRPALSMALGLFLDAFYETHGPQGQCPPPNRHGAPAPIRPRRRARTTPIKAATQHALLVPHRSRCADDDRCHESGSTLIIAVSPCRCRPK